MLRTLTVFHLFQYNPLRMILPRSRYDVIADSAHTLFLRTLTNLKFQSQLITLKSNNVGSKRPDLYDQQNTVRNISSDCHQVGLIT